MENFLCGIMYYHHFKDENQTLFDSDDILRFSLKQAKTDKITEKVQWSHIDDNEKTYKIKSFSKALSDFYISGAGNLSDIPLSSDERFQANKFLVKFL